MITLGIPVKINRNGKLQESSFVYVRSLGEHQTTPSLGKGLKSGLGYLKFPKDILGHISSDSRQFPLHSFSSGSNPLSINSISKLSNESGISKVPLASINGTAKYSIRLPSSDVVSSVNRTHFEFLIERENGR